MKIKVVKTIEVQDWDRLVEETYKKPYSFQQQDGCKKRGIFEFSVPDYSIGGISYDFQNDSVPDVINGALRGVSFKAWLDRDVGQWNGDKEDIDFIEIFWHRNWYPDIQMIANDLCEKGLIEPGEYIINIDW